jgi:hypothetical protein
LTGIDRYLTRYRIEALLYLNGIYNYGSLSHQVTAPPSQYTYVLALGTQTYSRCPPIIGKFYLVDAGYACRNGFLPSYRGVRYHLIEYGNRNHPTNANELFNLRHSSLRVTVKRAFGVLKNRFCILDNCKILIWLTFELLVFCFDWW